MLNVTRNTMNRFDKMAASKIVRAIMKAHGKNWVFNNIYDTGTRTVKCYGNREACSAMVDDIARTLTGLGVHYIVKSTKGSPNMRVSPAIIIKLV